MDDYYFYVMRDETDCTEVNLTAIYVVIVTLPGFNSSFH